MASSRYFDSLTLENLLRLLRIAATGSQFQMLKIANASGRLKRRSGATATWSAQCFSTWASLLGDFAKFAHGSLAKLLGSFATSPAGSLRCTAPASWKAAT